MARAACGSDGVAAGEGGMSEVAMRSALGMGVARLRDHRAHCEIVKRKLRDVARCFEELAEMSRDNAEAATRAALDHVGPTPEFSRRETWTDRQRLLERSAAMGEVASAIRCELAVGCRSMGSDNMSETPAFPKETSRS